MENLFSKVGKTAIKVSVKVLAAVCTGVLTAIDAVSSSGKKGGK